MTKRPPTRAPASSAARVTQRSMLKDPRFTVGIVLVVLAVTAGIWLVRAADQRVPVWAAERTLTPGAQLAGNVRLAQVHPDVADRYLKGTEDPRGSVTRTIGEGELVARSATTTDTPAAKTRSIVLPLGTHLPSGATVGHVVDVWFVPEPVPGTDTPDPYVIGPGALIERVNESDSIGLKGFGSIEVTIGEQYVGALLRGLTEQGILAVVPQGGTL